MAIISAEDPIWDLINDPVKHPLFWTSPGLNARGGGFKKTSCADIDLIQVIEPSPCLEVTEAAKALAKDTDPTARRLNLIKILVTNAPKSRRFVYPAPGPVFRRRNKTVYRPAFCEFALFCDGKPGRLIDKGITPMIGYLDYSTIITERSQHHAAPPDPEDSDLSKRMMKKEHWPKDMFFLCPLLANAQSQKGYLLHSSRKTQPVYTARLLVTGKSDKKSIHLYEAQVPIEILESLEGRKETKISPHRCKLTHKKIPFKPYHSFDRRLIAEIAPSLHHGHLREVEKQAERKRKVRQNKGKSEEERSKIIQDQQTERKEMKKGNSGRKTHEERMEEEKERVSKKEEQRTRQRLRRLRAHHLKKPEIREREQGGRKTGERKREVREPSGESYESPSEEDDSVNDLDYKESTEEEVEEEYNEENTKERRLREMREKREMNARYRPELADMLQEMVELDLDVDLPSFIEALGRWMRLDIPAHGGGHAEWEQFKKEQGAFSRFRDFLRPLKSCMDRLEQDGHLSTRKRKHVSMQSDLPSDHSTSIFLSGYRSPSPESENLMLAVSSPAEQADNRASKRR